MAMINHHTKGSSVLEVVEQTITQTVTRETSNGATITADQIGKSLSSKSNGLFAVGAAVSSVPPAPATSSKSSRNNKNSTRLHKPQKSARAQAVLEAHGNDFYNTILRNDLHLGDSEINQIAKLASGHVDIRATKNKGLAIHDQLRYNQYQGQAQVQAQTQAQAQQLQLQQQQQQQQQSLTINANGIQGLNNGNTSINGFASYNATNNNGNHYNYNVATLPALPPTTTATASASANGYNSLLTPRVNNYNNSNNNNGNNFNYMNYNTNNLNVAAIGQAMHNYYNNNTALNAAVNAYASAYAANGAIGNSVEYPNGVVNGVNGATDVNNVNASNAYGNATGVTNGNVQETNVNGNANPNGNVNAIGMNENGLGYKGAYETKSDKYQSPAPKNIDSRRARYRRGRISRRTKLSARGAINTSGGGMNSGNNGNSGGDSRAKARGIRSGPGGVSGGNYGDGSNYRHRYPYSSAKWASRHDVLIEITDYPPPNRKNERYMHDNMCWDFPICERGNQCIYRHYLWDEKKDIQTRWRPSRYAMSIWRSQQKYQQQQQMQQQTEQREQREQAAREEKKSDEKEEKEERISSKQSNVNVDVQTQGLVKCATQGQEQEKVAEIVKTTLIGRPKKIQNTEISKLKSKSKSKAAGVKEYYQTKEIKEAKEPKEAKAKEMDVNIVKKSANLSRHMVVVSKSLDENEDTNVTTSKEVSPSPRDIFKAEIFKKAKSMSPSGVNSLSISQGNSNESILSGNTTVSDISHSVTPPNAKNINLNFDEITKEDLGQRIASCALGGNLVQVDRLVAFAKINGWM